MRSRFLILLLLSTLALRAAPSAPEFVGVATSDGVTRLAFRDPASGTSQWLKIGGAFGEYTLAAYDVATQTAELTRGPDHLHVNLTAASVADLPAEPPTPEQTRQIFNNLRFIAAAGEQYYLENGKSITSAANLIGPEAYIKSLPSVSGENYLSLSYNSQFPVLSVKTSSGASIVYDGRPVGPENISTLYFIQKGDTVRKVAQAHGLSLADLRALNPGLDPTRLSIGQVIRIRP